ncbi:Uncharacterized protein PECH_005932 [Penicillium ucsense]|uniref:Uncharacterized protein n=1 Tax=Penicillium ucsense TaxID=2839758 RepID=A0A8J8WJ89_9EURO|nr:Uncharacterized protein PECM_002134 [Penicillium ucsense]KAF7736007.1 Uncharacterized protein PECH_005932 [Penicillium ucsense]
MDNEIPLPPPRRVRYRSPSRFALPGSGSGSGSIPSSFHKSRRFSRFDDRSSQPSSDPALFSSDDIPASGVENYHAPVEGAGRKRRYRGTWWGEQVIDPKRKRADFKEKRNVDSGVWMGSDDSFAESCLPSEDASNWGEDLLKTVLDPRAPSKAPNAPYLARASESTPILGQSRATTIQGPVESEEHKYAKAVIDTCLERGDDNVDLGGINLRTIPPGLLRPLQHLTKLPSLQEAPISENAYSSLQPFLRLYLSNNSLTNLDASEIFELKDLTVLSLRNNKLTRIPEAIRKLTALQVLNISVNRLSELPWDLLWLMQQGELKHLTARPNSFPTIDESDSIEWHGPFGNPDNEDRDMDEDDEDVTPSKYIPTFRDYEGRQAQDERIPLHVASGPVEYFDMEGRPVNARDQIVSSAPSLREVSLRAISRLPGVEQLTDEELNDEFPALVIPLIALARRARQEGIRHCSVCEREFVIPRAAWTEWWDCTPHENGMKRARVLGEQLRPLPFKRSVCSWACAPRER